MSEMSSSSSIMSEMPSSWETRLEMPSSCQGLSSTLNQLSSELLKARHRFSHDFHADHVDVWLLDQRPLFSAFRRLHKKPDLSVLGDERLYWDLQSTIMEIEVDNRFFETSLNSICRWTDAVQVMSLEPLVRVIEDVVGQISLDSAIYTEDKFMVTKPLELLQALKNWKVNFELLKLRFGGVPDCLEGSYSIMYFPVNDCSVWEKFVESVCGNLRVLILEKVNDECPYLGTRLNTFIHKLNFLQTFLRHTIKPTVHFDITILDFLKYAINVVARTAYQSCHCWFLKKDPISARRKITDLLDIQYEIDLTNPGFLDFILKFLASISKTNHFHRSQRESWVLSFLNCLLKTGTDLSKELTSLVTFVIISPEESHKNVQIFVTEIKAMLLGVGFLWEQVSLGGRINPSLRSELLMKICLLTTEASLVERLNDSLSSIPSNSKQIGELFEILNTLTTISIRLPEEKIKNGELALALVEELTVEVPMLYRSFEANKITRYRVKTSLWLFLIRIMIFKSESFLMDLLNISACFTIVGKDLIESLLSDLNLFSTIVRSQQVNGGEGLESIFPHVEAVTRRLTVLSYLFVANEITEQMIKSLMFSFTDSLDKVNLIKTKLREICPVFPVSGFPKINELGFLDFLLQNLSELLNHNSNSISPVKHHIQEVQLHLVFLRPFLNHILKSDNLELKNLGENVIYVAYKLEYVIDMIEVSTSGQLIWWFYELVDEIRHIKLQAIEIHENTGGARVHNVANISSHSGSRASSREIGEMVVSLDDEEEFIRCRLLRGSSQRDIVSIVGMPGIGKTTLAKKVYNDPNIKYHFQRRAWCSVSQMYGKTELLLDIIKDVYGVPDEIHQKTDADLELNLYRRLKRIRYLIVMDDVWDIKALNDIERSFPDDGTGSRILITSRFYNVASEAKPNSNPHMLRPLSDDESWQLLEMKSFPKIGSCPEELVEMGKEIARQCKGLPLAVVAISGILERTKKKQDHWEKIAKSLSSMIIADPETRCKDILELSYVHLPCHLKACFLYFGSFSEDQEVPVSKLIRLWIAEGFIVNIEGPMWEMREDEFCKLKYLKFDTLNIAHWNATEEHLPQLKQLVLRNCKNLEEVPIDFAYISTLQTIEVQGCKPSVEVSVRKILEATDVIEVIIS